MDDPIYATSFFEGFLTEDIDYATWFLESLAVPIIDDCPVSGAECWGVLHTLIGL